mmetsp:Transcript_149541/g.261326  ORF Transcript_149541/g.261326 Transcript_149541/m.261326 type:complete len:108 (-) Transcript_149541:840-1163(-)
MVFRSSGVAVLIQMIWVIICFAFSVLFPLFPVLFPVSVYFFSCQRFPSFNMPGIKSTIAAIPAGVADALRYSMGGAPRTNVAPQQWDGYANSSHQVPQGHVPVYQYR